MITPEILAKSGSEHGHQAALFCWASQSPYKEQLKWMFAIPNGEVRDKITASKLKAQGVKAGVWDIFLPLSNGRYYGLFIEMKVGNNGLTPKQQEFLKELDTSIYQFVVCYSWVEARDIIIRYLTTAL